MANPDYNWPAPEKRKHIGKRYRRLDGAAKASGRAKYSSDLNPKGLLFGIYVHSPYAHAKIVSIDTSEAEKMPGVKAVHVVATMKPGTEVQWEGTEIAAVAATTEELARDAARKIKVEYEVMPHLVNEADLAKAGTRARQGGEAVTGDPEKAFKEAEVVSEGQYGITVINHCCLEPHGQVIQWQPGTEPDGKGDMVNAWPSTQNMTAYAATLAGMLKVPAANIKVKMDYIGGGFGSKFAPDAWGDMASHLSKKAGGAPVKLFLERAAEQMIAGNRPSAFAKIKVAGKKDGTITGWDYFGWGTGGFTGGNPPDQPYVFTNVPNSRRTRTPISVNAGPQRAWRAPGNQQASFLTCAAIEDFAAKCGLDPLEVFKKTAQYAPEARVATYRYQLDKAAELAEWKKLWKPRGTSSAGTIKRGMGIGVAAWRGMGHASQCRTIINPDGSVAVEINTQDIGTGTRTCIVQVVAETLGLQMNQIKLSIGDNSLPPDGASGGSTTIGGVSVSSRKSSSNALMKLFEAVAPSLNTQPENLEAVDGRIRVKGSPAKFLTWAAACRKIGATPISEMGANTGKPDGNLLTEGAGGAQIADVSVDTETGIVKVNRYVAVQDCGLVVNPRLSESQVYGAVIMGISTALFEERIIDNVTGKTLNPEMEFYKLAGIADIGNIVVHMDIRPEMDSRGVVGLGEPPAVPICAAISNAVANAIGVRVPEVPITPERVLRAMERKGESLMQAFAYANPATLQDALALLGTKWGEADVLAGGTDLLSLMKEYLHTPARVVNIKGIKELEGISKTADGLRIGALVTMDELAKNADVKAGFKALADAAAGVDSPQIRHMGTAGGDLCQRPRCWYFRQGFGLLGMKDGKSLIPEGENKYHSIFGDGPAYFVSASSLGPALVALGAKVKLASAKGTREVPMARWFLSPSTPDAREIALQPNEILTEIIVPNTTMRTSTYELRQKEALDWPLVTASVALEMNGTAVKSAKIVLGHVAPMPIDAPAAARALIGKSVSAANAEAAGKAAVASAKPLSQNSYKVTLAKVAIKRALLEAVKVAKA